MKSKFGLEHMNAATNQIEQLVGSYRLFSHHPEHRSQSLGDHAIVWFANARTLSYDHIVNFFSYLILTLEDALSFRRSFGLQSNALGTTEGMSSRKIVSLMLSY